LRVRGYGHRAGRESGERETIDLHHVDSLLNRNDKCLQAPRKKITARAAAALNLDFDLDTMAETGRANACHAS
jgi:hypothetical protein